MPDQTCSPQTTVAARAATRVYYLDWLRVIAILMVFVYHTARFFNLDGWSVKATAPKPLSSQIIFSKLRSTV